MEGGDNDGGGTMCGACSGSLGGGGSKPRKGSSAKGSGSGGGDGSVKVSKNVPNWWALSTSLGERYSWLQSALILRLPPSARADRASTPLYRGGGGGGQWAAAEEKDHPPTPFSAAHLLRPWAIDPEVDSLGHIRLK